jgi:hypothetical protein
MILGICGVGTARLPERLSRINTASAAKMGGYQDVIYCLFVDDRQGQS